MIHKKIEAFVKKYQLIKQHATVIVGVSGGPDSMALLHFLTERRKDNHLKLIAVGVDHQLRDVVSKADMTYVKEMCEKWDIPFETRKVDVVHYRNVNKVSTQVAARILRYDVFREMMEQYNADYLALGHHGDDQIETMLMGFMRTTTLQGLQGIPYKRPFSTGHVIRPLLPLTKEEIEAYCDMYGIEPRIDASNWDTSYTRNELRLHVVPILKNKNQLLHQTVQQLSETIQEDEIFLLTHAKELMKDIVNWDKNKQRATISIHSLIRHPVSLQRRVFRLTLDYLYKKDVPEKISYTHEEIFLQLIKDSTSNKTLHFPRNLFIEKSYNSVQLYFNQRILDDEKPYHYVIDQIPCQIELPNDEKLIMKKVDQIQTVTERENIFIYPEAELVFPLYIRHRQPGDRMTYKGLKGSKKVKDIFIDDKVPLKKRDKTYILSDSNNHILWLIGLRKKTVDPINGPYVLFEYVKSNDKGETYHA